MSDHATPQPPSVPELQARLEGVARLLQESRAIDPGARDDLAELVDELGTALQSGQVPPDELARVADATAHLAESLHAQHESGQVGAIRERLQQAAATVETRAPFLTGLVRQLSETLSNLGI
jgi:hypothetical protein